MDCRWRHKCDLDRDTNNLFSRTDKENLTEGFISLKEGFCWIGKAIEIFEQKIVIRPSALQYIKIPTFFHATRGNLS
jgi:hypothetical protein